MTDPRDPLDPIEAFVDARGPGALDDLIEWVKQLGAATPTQRAAITEGYRGTQSDSPAANALIERFGVEGVIGLLEERRTRNARAGFRFIDGDLPG